ncbi:hypothetical protein GY45DRAFT_1327509 [Cubamyces sp. BRFM 1775]|nr:hypothetical protein GY45DRAFT_1327509 [Cubamyces sp. BRFM 1775]
MSNPPVPMTPVQRVWLIDEVVRNILVQVPSVGCSKTLASCARVSTALSEPALDVLWSKMTGLLPLCELLPQSSDAVVGHPNHPEQKLADTIDAYAVISDRDWSRFMRYARRVRKLHYHCREGPSERLRHRTFAALLRRAAHAGVPLLPRLEELSWLQSSQDVAHYQHFISPSLRHITVYVQPSLQPEHRHANELLQLLNVQSPNVEELSLEGVQLATSLQPLRAFKRLRGLRLGSVNVPVSTILSYCAMMPRLSSLSVDLTQSPTHLGGFSSDSSLEALEVLHVAGPPSPIEELINAVRSPSLRSAHLSILIPEHDRDGGARCVATLSARFATSIDTVFVEYKRSADRLAPHAPRAFSHYAQPLLSLRGLRKCTLVVEDALPVCMADADVHAMAEAWPGLVSLEVTLGTSAALPSIVALGAFARCCPELESLYIPIAQDVSVLEDDSVRARDVMEEVGDRHGLRSLLLSGVGFTQRDSHRVMRYLLHTFPTVNLLPMLSAGVLRSSGSYRV